MYEDLNGVFPPVITIFKVNGDIDYEANKKLTDELISAGVDGIVYLGTSGEFPSITMKEKKNFLDVMIKHVDNRVKIIAGAGDTSLLNTMNLIEYCEKSLINAVLIVNPYFNVYTDEMVVKYYNEIASNTELPVLLYNIPGLTGYNFSYPVIKELVESNENIIGIKESLPDYSHIKETLKIKEYYPYFKIYCAYEDQALSGLREGIDGFINATANFAPEFTVNAYSAFKEKKGEELTENYELMVRAMDIYEYSDPLYLACKQAVYDRFFGEKHKFGERLPALSLHEKQKQDIKTKLKELSILK